jgi:hypothetical protein
MIPLVRTRSVFTSRWKALLWAIPIIWFAYTVGTSAPAPDANSGNSETANASDNNSENAPDSNAAQKIPATWN